MKQMKDMARRRRKLDPSKNRKLNEFLSILEIEEPKREQIIEFVEQLAFRQIKEASVGKKKPQIRLNR